MIRKLFAILIAASLCGCGFQVIYKERGKNADISYVDELAAIRIKKDRDRLSQELKNHLYDLLNPDYKKVEPKYFLIITQKDSVSPTFITVIGSSGRNRITTSVNYELKDLQTGKTIAAGSTSVYDNYDVSSNRFGTYTAENYVRSNLTTLAAQNIRNSLVNDFIEIQRLQKEKQ